jgi:hypothetical protein
MESPYLGLTRTLDGVREELRLYNDGAAWWYDATGSRVRPATTQELEEAKRAFWNLTTGIP